MWIDASEKNMVTIPILLILGILTGLEGFDLLPLFAHTAYKRSRGSMCHDSQCDVADRHQAKPGIVRMQVLVDQIRRLQFL